MENNLISPMASIHPNAKLGKNVTVQPFAVIEDNTEIGDDTVISSGAVICSGARIGQRCVIHNGAIIAGLPQDLKFEGEDSVAIIGDDCRIREYATVNRGTASKGKTVLGNNCLLMSYAHIGHDTILHNNIIIGNATQVAGEVTIDDFAIVSAGTLIHQFSRIGCHVMVQGGSRIPKDIPPYTLVGREPLVYCGINSVGLRRRAFTNEQINLIQNIYRIIYNKELNNRDAILLVEEQIEDSPERKIILDFIRNSKRGIIRGNK